MIIDRRIRGRNEMTIYIGLAAAALGFLLLVIALVLPSRPPGGKKRESYEDLYTPEFERFGKLGETAARITVESVLRKGDHLFTNVQIEYDGERAELDLVIVNKYGVFIIEVKNYIGYIVGNENDFEWRKYKTSPAGNTYEKAVRNPIRQLKREIYMMARYLNYFGQDVWVKGYAILLQGNSPVESPFILCGVGEIDRAIHTADKRMLNAKTVESIADLLS